VKTYVLVYSGIRRAASSSRPSLEVKSVGKQMVVTPKSASEQHNTRSGRQ